MTISMRVLPRFPARITATAGLKAERDGTDIVVSQDWGSLIRIPSVLDPNKQFFTTWNSDQDLYSTMSFTDTFNAVIDTTGLMGAATYDPQNIQADAFARANHTGTQAQSTIVNLTTDLAAKAPLASPALTGNPTAPTPAGGDNDTSIATTAFVQGELTAKAPLASPAFTGNPTAPTASPGDNDTSIATTAFVAAAITASPLAKIYTSPDQTITIGGTVSPAHTFGVVPFFVQFYMKCLTAEGGYSIGDLMAFNSQGDFDGSTARGLSAVVTTTNIVIRFSANAIQAVRKDNGNNFALTPANWVLIVKAAV